MSLLIVAADSNSSYPGAKDKDYDDYRSESPMLLISIDGDKVVNRTFTTDALRSIQASRKWSTFVKANSELSHDHLPIIDPLVEFTSFKNLTNIAGAPILEFLHKELNSMLTADDNLENIPQFEEQIESLTLGEKYDVEEGEDESDLEHKNKKRKVITMKDESRTVAEDETTGVEEDTSKVDLNPFNAPINVKKIESKIDVKIPGKENIDAKLLAVELSDILDLVKIVDPAIKYSGFSPRKVRLNLISKGTSAGAAATSLYLAFSAYSHIGNNVSKLNKKRVDVAIAMKVNNACSALEIGKVVRDDKGLTLPRLAIAFMPEYYIYRSFIAKDLQNQTNAEIDVKYKDISFYGCSDIRNKDDYELFHKEFSALIYGNGKGVDTNDEKFLKDYKRWNKVSIDGYNSDKGLNSRMKSVLSIGVMTRREAFKRIRKNIQSYIDQEDDE